MIFKDKLAYIVKNETRNNTNTKKYDLLNGDFIFEATFKSGLTNFQNEFCVLGRTGYNMGIFSHGDKSIKWSWWKIVGDEIVYDDLYFGSKDVNDVNENHARWWKEYIVKNTPVEMSDIAIYGLVRRWGFHDTSQPITDPTGWQGGWLDVNYTIDGIPNETLREWVRKYDNHRVKTLSLLPEIIKVKVIKKDNEFHLYLDDIFYLSKEIGILYDYSQQMITVGVGNPYSTEWDPMWYDGEIYDVKIYHSSEEKEENLYLWFDFERNSHFKTFDKSGNGNHGEIFYSQEFIDMKNEEFNKIARPAKII